MAAIHVLKRTAHGHLECLLHFLPPSGNNSVGVAWKTAALAAGVTGQTADPEGDPAEAAGIEAGDIVELRVVLPVDLSGKTAPEQQAALTAKAAAAHAQWLALQQMTLRYYGYTQGEVS